MAEGILCQVCGIEAPVKYVEFRQNIGMLVMRRYKTLRGNMCKRCVHKKYWAMSGTTLLLGPWGYISLVMTPVFLVMNTVRYVGALGLAGVPADAKVPTLDNESVARIQKYDAELTRRLNLKEPAPDVARAIARQAKVTPGQVIKYLVARSQLNRMPPALGFPVQPAPPRAVAPVEAIPLEPAADEDMDAASV